MKPVVDEDLKKLESFANKNGNDSPLEGFDIEFWKHRLSIQNLKFSYCLFSEKLFAAFIYL